MTTAETLLLDYDLEIANTRRTLERIPADRPLWVPHTKSFPIGKLAMHCATLPLFGVYVCEDPGMDLAKPLHPHPDLTFTTTEACLARLDDSATRCRAAIAATSDEAFAQLWPFSFGPQIIGNTSRALTFRQMCFNHPIHHTSQLGVYLRLLNIPVPALYGPSADEQWVG